MLRRPKLVGLDLLLFFPMMHSSAYQRRDYRSSSQGAIRLSPYTTVALQDHSIAIRQYILTANQTRPHHTSPVEGLRKHILAILWFRDLSLRLLLDAF
jgi:hypothetical protein